MSFGKIKQFRLPRKFHLPKKNSWRYRESFIFQKKTVGAPEKASSKRKTVGIYLGSFMSFEKKAVGTPEVFLPKKDSWSPREGFIFQKKTVGATEKVSHS